MKWFWFLMRFKIKIIEISDDLKSNHDFDFKIKIVPISGYSQQQIKWYPQRYLLANFEATLYFSRTEFTCT